MNIGKIREDRRSYWVNRYFESILLLSLMLSIGFLGLEYAILQAALTGRLSILFYALVFAIVVAPLFIFLFHLSMISEQMRREIETDHSK